MNLPLALRFLASNILVTPFVERLLLNNIGIVKMKEKLKGIFCGNRKGRSLCV
jgi:hypothetical protein